MAEELESFEEQTSYKFRCQGSFGRFQTGNSFPIDYLMTTLPANQLSELSYARELKPESVNFELLMQRDIDDERVRKRIAPYLDPSHSDARTKSRPVFFPPLLAAVIPVEHRNLKISYSDEIVYRGGEKPDGPTNPKYIIREWEGYIRLTYKESTLPTAMSIIDPNDESKVYQVLREPVLIELAMAYEDEVGVKMIVIDGQHRLAALRELKRSSDHGGADLLSNLIVPVCIVFAPDATPAKESQYSPTTIPTIPEVFRALFVDVNSTMELVGGHFNILLGDDTVSKLACRVFCSRVLKDYKKEGLALIEWNTKTRKESYNIVKDYSITSIGVIQKGLDRAFGKSKPLMDYVLNTGECEEELYPEGSDDEDYPQIKWDDFSLSQKRIIERQVEQYLVPSLEKIFFESRTFSVGKKIFEEELRTLQTLARRHEARSVDAGRVEEEVLEYIPIADEYRTSREQLKEFEQNVRREREQKIPSIVTKALFQRAIFDLFGDLAKLCKRRAIDLRQVADAVVITMDSAIVDLPKFMSAENEYMQNTVFDGAKIIVKEATRTAIENLVASRWTSREVREKCAEALGLEADSDFIETLHKKGTDSARKFIGYFEKERDRRFRANYRTDFYSLSDEEREALIEAEQELNQDLAKVEARELNGEEVSGRFDELVQEHVKEDVASAAGALQEALGLKFDLLGKEAEEEPEEVEED